ncbi:hypothetical protein [Martelella mangrovi]|uniref:Rps23 Pro-64 3,4-dihydroxylase Tpa1-like proline 4-hydroxylase n=1 Tax=Martelella mangrovi TaxID=1397477 RepID=A0ABV2IFY9_9HYPH
MQRQNELQEQILEQQKQAEAARQAQEQKALQLREQELSFQKEQALYTKERQAKADAIAARPDAVTVSGASAGTVGEVMTNDMTASSDDTVTRKKRGRGALRIDMNKPQSAGATGINIPQG